MSDDNAPRVVKPVRDQLSLQPMDLEALVPEDHPARGIGPWSSPVNYHTLSDFRVKHGKKLDRLMTRGARGLDEGGRGPAEAGGAGRYERCERATYVQRGVLAERTNADLRVHRGLDRLNVRGLAKVKTVVLLAALSFNLLKAAAPDHSCRSFAWSRAAKRPRVGSPAAMGRNMVRIKRAYEDPTIGDGYRVLIDRLWPRGVRKDRLQLDLWAKELAPAPELRKWFGHDPARFPEFARRYQAELCREPARSLVAALVERAAHGRVTLVYGARDQQHNGAVVLRDAIQDALRAHV